MEKAISMKLNRRRSEAFCIRKVISDLRNINASRRIEVPVRTSVSQHLLKNKLSSLGFKVFEVKLGKLTLEEMHIHSSFTGSQKEYKAIWTERFVNTETIMPLLGSETAVQG